MATWRRVTGGWACDDGRFLAKVPKSGLRRHHTAAATLGESVARTATCTCGWSATGASLSAANELWWAHEDAATKGTHRVSYSGG